MLKTTVVIAALGAAAPALAQSGQYAQPYPPPPAPQQPAQAAPQQPTQQAPSSTGSTAAPGGGAASQQVVVNPPNGTPPAANPPAPPPPASTTVVNPPPAPATVYGTGSGDVVVERRRDRNPMATVATDAAYGGVAGLIVGIGISLIDRGNHWERDLPISTGAGVLIGAVVGIAQAASDTGVADRVATDGAGSPARDPVIRTPPTLAFSGRF
jgi:hypothetical protein